MVLHVDKQPLYFLCSFCSYFHKIVWWYYFNEISNFCGFASLSVYSNLPPRLLNLKIFASLPVYYTLPFYILVEICQLPCLIRPPLLVETREWAHNHAPGILLWQCSCHRNEKQNSESFFNYDTILTSVITMELKYFFRCDVGFSYDVISWDVINVKNFREILNYFF